MTKMILGEEKGRVQCFITDKKRHVFSPVFKKLKNQCPTLALIASNIPPEKLKKWEITETYYHKRFGEVKRCLNSLIDHGAFLASQGKEDQLPALRDFICSLASFWPDGPDADDPIKLEEHYGALFDRAVSAAGNGEELPGLSPTGKENILIGLENYIIDLAGQFTEINQEALDSGLRACESIAAGIRETWYELCMDMAEMPVQQIGQTLG